MCWLANTRIWPYARETPLLIDALACPSLSQLSGRVTFWLVHRSPLAVTELWYGRFFGLSGSLGRTSQLGISHLPNVLESTKSQLSFPHIPEYTRTIILFFHKFELSHLKYLLISCLFLSVKTRMQKSIKPHGFDGFVPVSWRRQFLSWQLPPRHKLILSGRLWIGALLSDKRPLRGPWSA